MSKPVGAFKLFGLSKDAVMRNFVSFLVIIFLPAFVIIVGDAINAGDYLASPDNTFWNTTKVLPGSLPYYGLGGILAILLLPAGYYLELQAAKGKTVSISEAFNKGLGYFWRILGLSVLIGLIVLLGLLVFIIPGLIFVKQYFLAPYFMIDRNLGIRAAMSASKKASKGHAWTIFSVILVTILLSIFNIIPIWGGLISLILTTLYTCAPAFRYVELSSAVATSKAPKAPTN